MTANIYVDGFNLYYGIRNTPYKWLNLAELSRHLLPHATINRIRYFTARVKQKLWDPGVIHRQQAYLSALETIPNLQMHFGLFQKSIVRMPLAALPNPMVEVIKMEEKGSDVNIGAYMLLDAFKGEYDTAVVLSNDSDLVTPVVMVRNEFHRDVIILNPHRNPSAELRKVATQIRPIRQGPLRVSQFPPQLIHNGRVITKPALWDEHAWCRQCAVVHLSSRWVRLQCPACGASDSVAWSVICLSRTHFPAVPVPGQIYR